jgi:hypothetical protein
VRTPTKRPCPPRRDGRSGRRSDAKHADAKEKPYIRRCDLDRVEFECDGKFLAAPYEWRGDNISLGSEHEVELMFTSKRPK